MGGCFLFKKVENWGCVVKSEEWGVFLCKKVDLFSTQGALCTVSVFFILHFTYLGGAYPPNAPPCLRACIGELKTQDLKMGGTKKTKYLKMGDHRNMTGCSVLSESNYKGSPHF